MADKTTKIICDTSVIIDGKISELIEKGEIKNIELIIPAAALDELQSQASKGREHGFVGLEELKKIRRLTEEKGIKMRFTGEKPSMDDIRLAHSGRIDAMIRDVAKNEGGILYTADYVQALVGEAEGVRVRHIPAAIKTSGLKFEKYFDKETLSVHLKEGVAPLAKRGGPGKFQLLKLSNEPATEEEIDEMIKEIMEATRISEEGSVEISRAGATVVQFGNYRIAIARPPFSDGLEVTIVRPVAKLSIYDYKLSEKLMDRLGKSAEGILIAGPPGSGKSTLASSLAEFYMHKGKIVKTLESPRDLQVDHEITQYGPLEGDFEKTADILLLVRPDYTVYDEVRKTRDFEIFSDLRLAGIGMIGVVHSSKAIDAVQRFLGRIELGLVPHIIDTVIFVKEGEVKQILELSLTVRVPHGMTEQDLARPLVEIRDFETGDLLYEIYTFGEENIIVPVLKQEKQPGGLKKLAVERVLQEIKRFDPDAEVDVISENKVRVKVENEVIGRVIGKEGSMINALEKKLGIHIDVEPKTPSLGKEIMFGRSESGNSIELNFDKRNIGEKANIYIDDQFLFSAIIGKKSNIRVSKSSDLGKQLVNALVSKKKIRVML
jgi:ATPase